MPVMECEHDGLPGFKWGESGNKCFTYQPGDDEGRERARKQAEEQGRVIEAERADAAEWPPRVLIIGGPSVGKSTLAKLIAADGRDAHDSDELIELGWTEASDAGVVWLDFDGPWVLEGTAMVRALRKWLKDRGGKPADLVVFLQRPLMERSSGQDGMAAGVATIFAQVEPQLRARAVEVKRLEPSEFRADSADGILVQRFDQVQVQLEKFSRTPEGFLVIPGRIAKPGILEYKKPGGGVRRELIEADELFRDESMATLHSKPVTIKHPPRALDARNVAEHAVGHVGETVGKDADGYLSAPLIVMHASAISQIENGGMEKVSAGYFAKVVEEPGVDAEFGPFDAIQRNRRYNHVAIVDNARAGDDVRLRLDDANNQILPSRPTPSDNDNPPGGKPMSPRLAVLFALATSLGLPVVERDDAVFRQDGEDALTEERLVELIKGAFKDQAAAAPAVEEKKEDESHIDPEVVAALEQELQVAKDKVAALETELGELRTDAEARETADQAAADKVETKDLDDLAGKLNMDSASKWTDETSLVDRKLAVLRHDGIIDDDETPEGDELDGMIKVVAKKATSAAEARTDSKGAFKGLGKQVGETERQDSVPKKKSSATIRRERFEAEKAEARKDADRFKAY